MAYPPTCLACHRPFPASSALLASPFGRRLAVDPTHRRAWRICERCGEWNLLGAEEGAHIADEVQPRVAGASIRKIDAGIDEVDLGDVTILRVDLTPGEAVNPGVVERLQKLHARNRRLAIGMPVVGLGLLLFWGISWLDPNGYRIPGPYFWGPPIVIAGFATLGQVRRLRRLALPGARTRATLGLLMLAIGAALSASHPTEGLRSLLPAVLTGAHIGGFVTQWVPHGRATLPSGTTVWIRQEELDCTRLDLADDGTLRLTLPSGRSLDREDSEAMLRDLLDGLSWEGTGEMQRAGLALARGEDQLPRVLEMLRPMMAESPDGVPLARLPGAWRAALDLALAASTGTPGKLSALAEKAREAQQVATIAESLDRPTA